MSRTVFVMAIVIMAALLMGCASFKMPFNLAQHNQQPAANMSGNASSGKNASNAILDIPSCLSDRGIPMSIIFIYADWCPHCQKMKPWVQQLEDKGYKVFETNVQNSTEVQNIRDCLSGIAELKYVPEFICPINKQDHVGEFETIDEMEQFIANCA